MATHPLTPDLPWPRHPRSIPPNIHRRAHLFPGLTPALAFILGLVLVGSNQPLLALDLDQRSFTNATELTLFDEAPASLFPSTVRATGLRGVVTQVAVSLRGLTHSYPDDLDILLVAPSGENCFLMSDAGGSFPVNGVTLTFAAGAPAIPNVSQIVAGTYLPANYGLGPDTFPAPAPTGNHGASLAVFEGIDPNGTWSLYVVDDLPENDGAIAGGWSLTVQTAEETQPALSIETVGRTARVTWTDAAVGFKLHGRDSAQEPPAWSAVTNSVAHTNGQNRVVIPLQDPQRLFRLQK
jgi:subtilisin-like proprotein convertase family protein